MAPRFGILTISDRSASGERPDVSGRVLIREVENQGWRVVWDDIVPDEFDVIADTLIKWAESKEIDIILTTGGTGFTYRDITPEATQSVITKNVPGIAEAMRSASLEITPHAMLSRGTAGIRGRTLIVNLPGSPKGALENFTVIRTIIPHAVQLLREDPEAEAGHSYSE